MSKELWTSSLIFALVALGTALIVHTLLNTTGHPSSQPFPTVPITSPTTPLAPLTALDKSAFSTKTGAQAKAPEASSIVIVSSNVTAAISTKDNQEEQFRSVPLNKMPLSDIFVPVATGTLPAALSSRSDHPVLRHGIAPQKDPLSTNKFYANFFLGDQMQGTWTHPYSVSWAKGTGNAKSYGLSISHIDSYQRANDTSRPERFYINPIGIQSMILSATSLGTSTVLLMNSLKAFSANLNMLPIPGAPPAITFPLVQGMGFVTANYSGAVPLVQSSVFFRTVSRVQSPHVGVVKYKFVLEDGKTWLLYATPSYGGDFSLNRVSNTMYQSAAPFTGTIQIAKNPGDGSSLSGESFYDQSAGVYPVSGNLSGSVSGTKGAYSLTWTKGGLSATGLPLLMFALPHHVESFDQQTNRGKTSLKLQTTTKGITIAFLGDSWTMLEPKMPIDMGFAPWTLSNGSVTRLSPSAIQVIQRVARNEVSQDMSAACNTGSMYFSGKVLSKYATLIYTMHSLSDQQDLAAAGLIKLKAAFATFVQNKQMIPLVYETVWKGVVSTGSYLNGDSGADFGNTYYNDHHFHWGYFIHAAAVIATLDPTWLPGNIDWVNMLVRDAANPSADDLYFPVSRSFDWYHGHSWAKGLFESADGKDEESSSEDAMFAYAIKMWGAAIGDANMEARGNLMLAVLARTLKNYFLLEDDNTNQPKEFIGNKVTGILFENKVDHTTYFGTAPSLIQGIHMIPLLPFSTYTRSRAFVQQEWDTYFSQGRIDAVDDGWKGILYANLAIVDPRSAWRFFAGEGWEERWLDGGACRAWYLAFVAGKWGFRCCCSQG
ncbi:MAG: hypothetical protein M1835_000650 [Candelina submexicana]|nr:MAG: hypothetical protein M1835_000650 [Candelina submexicana]